MQQDAKSILATGRRKESIARVRLVLEGKGKVTINGKELDKYFVTVDQVMQVKKPFTVSSTEGKFDVLATVTGGGINGQAGAISLGISRALLGWNPELRPALRKENLLTRDPRSKERKKYGRKGARRRFQWTKR
ncbi:MAG: 30S ribosomal protein S9 [Candidatus Omnitrophica bacterium]|nr:30S ribosomal protein S9 [Candidatus Omnitrophota bacterium]